MSQIYKYGKTVILLWENNGQRFIGTKCQEQEQE